MLGWFKAIGDRRRERSFWRREARLMEPYWARESREKSNITGAGAACLWAIMIVAFFTYKPMGPVTAVWEVESAWVQGDTCLVFAVCEQSTGKCDTITVQPDRNVMNHPQWVRQLLKPGQYAIFAMWGDNAIDQNGDNPGLVISECYAACADGRPMIRELCKFNQEQYQI